MSDNTVRVGVLMNASSDPTLIEEGRRLVAMTDEADGPSVLPALAVIMACAALEMALEGSLKLAEARAKSGGKSVGFLYDVRLEDIADAFKKSLRWKTEHVPSIVTGGELKMHEAVPELVEPLRELVECRNQLVHGRGELTQWETELQLGDGGEDRVVDGGPSRTGWEELLGQKGLDIEMTMTDGSHVRVPISPPWGLLWVMVSSDRATRYLDAVAKYINACVQAPETGQPKPAP
jgi:hypothetical protein